MADKGEYRGIYVALPDDPDFQELSADARSCFYPLKLKLGKAGIDVFYMETLPRLTGLSPERCEEGVQELLRRGWLRVERTVFWIRNGLLHDPAKPLASPTGRTGVSNHLTTLPKLKIANDFARYYELPLPFPELESEKPQRRGLDGASLTETDNGRRKTEDGDVPLVGELVGELAREDFSTEQLTAMAAHVANAGMVDNPNLGAGAFQPVDPELEQNRQTVAAWLAAGISPAAILEEVYHGATSYRPKPRKPQVRVLSYFDIPVRERLLLDTSRAVERPKSRRNGARTDPAPNTEAARVKSETPGRERQHTAHPVQPLPEHVQKNLAREMKRLGLSTFLGKSGLPSPAEGDDSERN